MTGIIEDQVQNEEFASLEQETPEVSEIQAEDAKPKEEIPEKYRGKALQEVIKMHQEAEKLMSRHAQEVGEVRKLADELIKAQLVKKPVEEAPKEKIDYFENPDEAVRQAIENNPRVKAAEQAALNMQQQLAYQSMAAKHPDFREINADYDFQNWVNGSKVRQSLYQAAQNFDADAADELLSTFKQIRAVKQQAVSEGEKKAREASLKTAAVETSGTGESPKKIYRRSDIMKLMATDRARYDAMQDEIVRAYAEGRVR